MEAVSRSAAFFPLLYLFFLILKLNYNQTGRAHREKKNRNVFHHRLSIIDVFEMTEDASFCRQNQQG